MAPFYVIPIAFLALTGGAIETNYCENEEARAQQKANAAENKFVPTGDKLCDWIASGGHRRWTP